MRIASTVLLGAFMLIGALPGAGAQPAPADKASPDSSGQRDKYIQKSDKEMAQWQAKLSRFDAETGARAQNDGAATRADLAAALDKAEAEASKLQTVAADGLEDAKVSYDKATTELSDAWGKVRPEDRADKASGD